LTVLHYNVNFEGLLVNISIVIPHNVRVLQLTEDVDLSHNLLLLLLVHASVVEFLPDHDSSIMFAPNFSYSSEAT
jgi:hypothetical protein